MLFLFNKKKVVIGSVLYLLSSISVQAAQLHLNSSESLNITDAAYLDIQPGVQFESPVDLNETLIYLDSETAFSLDLHAYSPIEFFWDGFPLPLPDFDSQWLFLNELCEKSENIHVVSKPYGRYFVMRDQPCKTNDAFDGLALTVISIVHKLPLHGKPDARSALPVTLGDLDHFFNSHFPDAMTTSFSDPTAPDLTSFLHLPDSILLQEKTRLWVTDFHNLREVTVFIVNIPITKQNLRHVPGGEEMNQVVERAKSEQALYELIIKTMTQLGFRKKIVGMTEGPAQFQAMVRSPDKPVNVHLVINFIKKIISHYRSNIEKQNVPETVREIVLAMLAALKKEEEKEKVRLLAEATGTTPPHPASAIPVHQLELVQQLVDSMSGNANKIVRFIFFIVPHLQKRLGYAKAKSQIKNKKDDSINLLGVITLLSQRDDWETKVKAALEPKQAAPEQEDQRPPRQKRPSSQGPLEKKPSDH